MGSRFGRTYSISVAITISCCFFFFGFIFVNQVEFFSITKAGKHASAASTEEISLTSSALSLATKTTTASKQRQHEAASSTIPAFRLLIGILSLPDKYRHRNLLRWIYSVQTPKISQIDVKFVFCNLTTEEQEVIIALEIMRYNDIIILNCKENMDGGKTYTYFSSMNDIFDSPPGSRPAPYDYIMKADDDTFILLGGLEESLRDLAREDMYYGFVTPCKNMETTPDHYMSGMGYILSWDLAEHIRNSSYAKSHQTGPEDLLTGAWLKDGKVARNRYNMKPRFYDFPGTHACGHDLIPNTIAIHRLKEQDQWIQALNYFNFTMKLNSSKLYHIP